MFYSVWLNFDLCSVVDAENHLEKFIDQSNVTMLKNRNDVLRKMFGIRERSRSIEKFIRYFRKKFEQFNELLSFRDSK